MSGVLAASRSEASKLTAFLRRDLLVLLSYRTAVVSDWLNLLVQITLFSFVARMVDPASLPSYAASTSGYLGFVTVGIAVAAFLQVGLYRVASALRQEQLIGTLESLVLTPTSFVTIQIGSALYDLLYVPVRTVVFLVAVNVLFDVPFLLGHLVPTMVVLAALIPVVWGIGIVGAAAVVTFRRGAGVIGMGAVILSGASGAYFPVELLPAWLQGPVGANPIAVALEAMRHILLAGEGWSAVWPALANLVPSAVVALALGVVTFRVALRREISRGTLGLY